jgi:hypothetical protein
MVINGFGKSSRSTPIQVRQEPRGSLLLPLTFPIEQCGRTVFAVPVPQGSTSRRLDAVPRANYCASQRGSDEVGDEKIACKHILAVGDFDPDVSSGVIGGPQGGDAETDERRHNW